MLGQASVIEQTQEEDVKSKWNHKSGLEEKRSDEPESKYPVMLAILGSGAGAFVVGGFIVSENTY